METFNSFGNNEGQRFLPLIQNSNRERLGSASTYSRNSDSWELSLRDDRTFVTIDIDEESSVNSSFLTSGIKDNSNIQTNASSDSPSKHQGIIAQALGLSLTERILQFGFKTKSKDTLKKHGKKLAKSLINENEFIHMKNKKAKNKVVAEIIPALSYVGAPGLRNDFYSDLVSWSTINNQIIVALDIYVYAWSLLDYNVDPILITENDPIYCVSCAANDYVVVGSLQGKIHLISQRQNNEVKAVFEIGKSVHSIKWFADNLKFLVSDISGDVLLFQILTVDKGVELKLTKTLSSHRQLICGN